MKVNPSFLPKTELFGILVKQIDAEAIAHFIEIDVIRSG